MANATWLFVADATWLFVADATWAQEPPSDSCCRQPLGLHEVLDLLHGGQPVPAVVEVIRSRCVAFETNVTTTNAIMRAVGGGAGADVAAAAQSSLCSEPRAPRLRVATESRETALAAVGLAEAYLRTRGAARVETRLSGGLVGGRETAAAAGSPSGTPGAAALTAPAALVRADLGDRDVGFDIRVIDGDPAAGLLGYRADAVLFNGALPDSEAIDLLNEHELGFDRPVVIINRQQPVREIAAADLRRLLCVGEEPAPDRWQALGGTLTVDDDDAIHLYRSAGPVSAASPLGILAEALGAEAPGAETAGAEAPGVGAPETAAPADRPVDGGGLPGCRIDEARLRPVDDVAAAVAGDPLGLGVVRLAEARGQRELAVRYPTVAAVIRERTMRFYSPRFGSRPRFLVNLANEFASFLKSGPGQLALAEAGLLPLGDLAPDVGCPHKICTVSRGSLRRLSAEARFGFGSYGWQENERIIGALIHDLRSQSGGRPLVLKGFSDDLGSAGANCAVSRLRAEAVRERLTAAGFQVAEVVACGLRSENSETRRGRAGNRVVEVWATQLAR